NPLSANCAAQAATAGAPFANCCLGPSNDPFLDPLVQERAWTSPIWYRPESIARLRAEVRYGSQPGSDRLALRLFLARVPKDLPAGTTDVELRVSDDDDILGLTIPAGALVPGGRGRFAIRQPIGPVTKATLELGQHGATLVVLTAPTDLSRADRDDHMVTVSLAAGVYRAAQSRLWVMHNGRLMPGGR